MTTYKFFNVLDSQYFNDVSRGLIYLKFSLKAKPWPPFGYICILAEILFCNKAW